MFLCHFLLLSPPFWIGPLLPFLVERRLWINQWVDSSGKTLCSFTTEYKCSNSFHSKLWSRYNNKVQGEVNHAIFPVARGLVKVCSFCLLPIFEYLYKPTFMFTGGSIFVFSRFVSGERMLCSEWVKRLVGCFGQYCRKTGNWHGSLSLHSIWLLPFHRTMSVLQDGNETFIYWIEVDWSEEELVNSLGWLSLLFHFGQFFKVYFACGRHHVRDMIASRRTRIHFNAKQFICRKKAMITSNYEWVEWQCFV